MESQVSLCNLNFRFCYNSLNEIDKYFIYKNNNFQINLKIYIIHHHKIYQIFIISINYKQFKINFYLQPKIKLTKTKKNYF